MTDPTSDLQALVRRDLRLFVGGTAVALAAFLLVGLGRLDVIDERGSAWVVLAATVVVWAVCLTAWLRGPRRWLRDRYLLLVPVFLITGPGVLAIATLAGDPLAFVASIVAVVIAIPVIASLVLGGRRARRRA